MQGIYWYKFDDIIVGKLEDIHVLNINIENKVKI